MEADTKVFSICHGLNVNKLLLLFLILFVGCSGKTYNKSNDILLQLHNNERSNDLIISHSLNEIAEAHAANMALKGRLKHQNMNIILNDGWNYVGENIAKNQVDEYEVFQYWMNSRGHLENIKNSNFTHVGFGLSVNENNEKYWCACFGARR